MDKSMLLAELSALREKIAKLEAAGVRLLDLYGEMFAEAGQWRTKCGTAEERVAVLEAECAALEENYAKFREQTADRTAEICNTTERLREALTWAVGFIRCNFPKAREQYEDMRNAESLAEAHPVHTGEFQRARALAEIAEFERDRLQKREELHRLRYGIDSPNGDVIDWLYTWLKNPINPANRAILSLFLTRHGYDDAAELLAAKPAPEAKED